MLRCADISWFYPAMPYCMLVIYTIILYHPFTSQRTRENIAAKKWCIDDVGIFDSYWVKHSWITSVLCLKAYYKVPVFVSEFVSPSTTSAPTTTSALAMSADALNDTSGAAWLHNAMSQLCLVLSMLFVVLRHWCGTMAEKCGTALNQATLTTLQYFCSHRMYDENVPAC